MRDWAAHIREQLAAEHRGPGLTSQRQAVDAGGHREEVAELAAHLDDVYRASRSGGADEMAAERAAEAELAGLGPLSAVLAARSHRAFHGRAPRSVFTGLAGDVRQGLRLFRTRPGIAALAIATLALGIGASVTVFSIYNGVIRRPLPFPNADRLVLLREADIKTPTDMWIVAQPVYEDWRARAQTLESLGIWEFLRVNIAGSAEPEQIPGIRASSSLFHTLGVAPALGRVFTADEDAAGHHVAIISNAIWRAHFNADPAVLTKQIRVNGTPHAIVGVMPAGFEFPRAGNGIWVPIAFTPQDRDRNSHSFWVVARMKAGVAFEQTRDEMHGIGRDLAAAYPDNSDETSTALPMGGYGMDPAKRMLAVLAGAAGFVLLIACVNVANLQIAQAVARRREFLTRIALGAGTSRIARQLLIEGMAIALAAGAAGAFLAWIGTRSLDALLGADFLVFLFRGKVAVTLDPSVLVFCALISASCALIFAFGPLVGLRRAALGAALRDDSRGVTGTALGLRRLLVASEVALAVVVLCGAGLLIKSVVALASANPGLDADRVLTMQVSLPQVDTYGPAERKTFCADVSRAMDGGPFVSSGAISHLPLSGANAGRGLEVEGFTPPSAQEHASASYRVTCPGYFATLGIRLREGRDFQHNESGRVVIVNKTFADTYWKGERAVGKRLGLIADPVEWMTVVGVTEDVRHFGIDSDVRQEMFVPYGQAAWPGMTLVAKARDDITPAAEAALKDVIRRTNPEVPAAVVRPMRQIVLSSFGDRRSFTRLVLVFASMGLALSAIGVYGVLAYYVSQRRREIGVRVALGASRPAVARLILLQSLIPISGGVLIGVLGSIWAGRLIKEALYLTQPGDVIVTTAVAGTVLLVGLAASWLPAHRAASVDPTIALRE
jgi:putative ABC transport system permease protein